MGNGKGYPSECAMGGTAWNGFVANKGLTTAESLMGETGHD